MGILEYAVIIMKDYLENNQNTATTTKRIEVKRVHHHASIRSVNYFIGINRILHISGLKYHPIIQVDPQSTFTLVSYKHEQSRPADDRLHGRCPSRISLLPSHQRLDNYKFKLTREGVSDFT